MSRLKYDVEAQAWLCTLVTMNNNVLHTIQITLNNMYHSSDVHYDLRFMITK